MLTMKDRDRLRLLQDKLLTRLKARHPDFPSHLGILEDCDERFNPTLVSLQYQVFPEYEAMFNQLLEDL